MTISPLVYPDQQHIPIYLQVIGDFMLIVKQENRTQYLKYDKAKLLLVLLVFSKKPVNRSLLAEMLWPDSDTDKGRSRLRHALHLLRQALGECDREALVVSNTEISIKPNLIFFDFFDFLEPIDSSSINEIKRKTDLYSLGFLQNIKLPTSDCFLDWHRSWQARYELELAQYRHQLVAYYIENNEIATALTYVKWWLCQSPKDESCYRYLIRLLLASGDKELALRAYQQCKNMLEESFNVLPSIETQSLVQSLASGATSRSVINNIELTQRALQPIASVAITLTFASSSHLDLSVTNITTAQLQHLKDWQNRLYQWCVAHEGHVSQFHDTTLFVHFGYPTVVERPIEQALHLVQKIRSLEPPNLKIQLAVHACSVWFQSVENLDAIIAPYVLPLVWSAKSGEVLLSPQAAARITEIPIEKIATASGPVYKLGNADSYEVSATTRMFGRIRYFDRIIQQWGRYILGQTPAVILLKGQAGLGKTQLAVAVADYVRNVEGRVLFLRSKERKHTQPYHAIADWLLSQLDHEGFSFEINRDSTQTHTFQQQLAKKHQISFDTSQALFEYLLFNPLQAKGQQQAITNAFLALISEYQGGKQPICIIWDDLQWIDQQSLALLESVAQSKTKKIAFILGLSRYEAEDYPWITMQLTLPPFDAAVVARYLNQRSKIRKIAPEVKQFILQSKVDNLRYVNDILHLASLTLPYKKLPRITDSIAVAFHYCSLEIQKIVFLSVLLPDVSKETIATVFEITPKELNEKLITLSNYGVFIPHLIDKENAAGVDLVRSSILPLISEEMKKEIFNNYTALANITIATKGPAALVVAQAYQDAAKSSKPENALQSCTVFWGQWMVQHGLGNFSAGLLAAQRLEQAALQEKNTVWLGWAYYAQAQCYLWQGQPEASETLLLQAITMINAAAHSEDSLSVFAGSQSSALAYSALALTQTLLGRYSPALQNAKYAIYLAEKSKEPMARMVCGLHLLRIYYLTNNLTALEKDCQLILDAMPEAKSTNAWYGFVLSYSIVTEHLKAPCLVLLKQLEQIREGIESNMPAALDGYLCTLARCYLASNKPLKALTTLSEASAFSEQHDSVLLLPEIHCLQGDAFLMLNNTEQAHTEWHKAKKIIKEQQLLVYYSWLNDRSTPEETVS